MRNNDQGSTTYSSFVSSTYCIVQNCSNSAKTDKETHLAFVPSWIGWYILRVLKENTANDRISSSPKRLDYSLQNWQGGLDSHAWIIKTDGVFTSNLARQTEYLLLIWQAVLYMTLYFRFKTINFGNRSLSLIRRIKWPKFSKIARKGSKPMVSWRFLQFDVECHLFAVCSLVCFITETKNVGWPSAAA